MRRRFKRDEIFVAVFWSPLAGKVGYRGTAAAITSKNKVGKFDVLPGHTNFISLISQRLTIQLLDKKTIDHEFRRGVIEVSDNLVKVFLGL